MSVSVVVFDLGKVLVDFDYGIASRRLAENARASADEVRSVIDQTPLLFRYESAGMTTQEFFDEVRSRIGFRGSFDEFAAPFADIFTEIPEMIAFQAELRARKIPTFILSNTNDIAVGHIRRRFPFFSNFEGYVLSYQQGVLKPQREIYEITEEITGASGEEILFIDDKQENVLGAMDLNWRVICHHSPMETMRLAREWLA